VPARDNARTRVTVVGLWHLGAVIAAVLADSGYGVVAHDADSAVLAGLQAGHPAVDEPGLGELVAVGLRSGALRLEGNATAAVADAEVVWIAHDTPVGEDDVAAPEPVLDEAVAILEQSPRGTLAIVSSQLPVGSVARLEATMLAAGREDIAFAVIPENLRLGSAIDTFRRPDRFVVGVRDASTRDRVAALLEPFASPLEWVGIESAEMAKHAINAFLAMSVAFINELAAICEQVGADALEVSRALRTESRIGPHAYLRPGEAFAGGTLARDLRFLAEVADRHDLAAPLVEGVWASNDEHRRWPLRTLLREMGDLQGRRVAVWGLTYKAGTDTLRRSSALSLCDALVERGASVCAHDPTVRELERHAIDVASTPREAARGADALVVCTQWPLYREEPAAEVLAAMASPLVIDPGGFLVDTLGAAAGVRYRRVGVSPEPGLAGR
jgi:UDPglucose 6-dehydrogenase